MEKIAKLGGCRPPGRVSLERCCPIRRLHIFQFNILAAVADSRGWPEHYRHLECLRKFVSEPDKLLCLLRACRVQHWHLREHGHQTTVLFCLRRVRSWVVCAYNDESAF